MDGLDAPGYRSVLSFQSGGERIRPDEVGSGCSQVRARACSTAAARSRAVDCGLPPDRGMIRGMDRNHGSRERFPRLVWLGGFALCVLFWVVVLLLVLR